MIISSMTTMFAKRREDDEFISLNESIRRHHALGYRVLDLNLCALQRDEGPFSGDDWKEVAYSMKETADQLGVSFYQGHLPFRSMKFVDTDEEMVQRLHDATMRAVEICGIAGVKWVVAHPVASPYAPAEEVELHVAENHRIYDRVVERLTELGVGIAFENVPAHAKIERFGSRASDLVALIDSYHSDFVGGCWDFGHGNLNYGELQTWGIRKMGKRLKALHFADNLGARDDHLPPFVGMINWEKIMQTLAEVDYDGCLVLETVQNSRLPDHLKESSMRFLGDVCAHLDSLFENAKKELKEKEV